jgi:hypothetical protein
MWKQLIFIVACFGVFLVSMFVVSPWIQTNWIEANQPYLIVDPEIRAETGCTYDYLTYIPIEVTGRDPSEGIRFPVTSVQPGAVKYVHYPESWTNPWNPFNPANKIGSIINTVGTILVWILGAGIVVYLIILWRKGVLKKMADKIKGEEDDI